MAGKVLWGQQVTLGEPLLSLVEILSDIRKKSILDEDTPLEWWKVGSDIFILSSE